MTRLLGVVLVMLVAATGVVACGDAGDGDGGDTAATATSSRPRTAPSPPPGGDAARAKTALVRLTDMPEGWGVQRGAVTRLHCGSLDPYRGADALVSSKRLTQEHLGVQERIAIFPSVAAARRALARLDSRQAAGCLRRELQRNVSEESGGPAGPAKLVRAERLGPTSHARRYVSTGVGNYGKVVGYIDAVHERLGRTVAALVLVSGPAVPDEELYERVVDTATRRLRATLG